MTQRAFIPGILHPNNYSSVAGIALSPDESKLYAAHWTDTGSDPIGVYGTASYDLLGQMSYGRCHGDVVVSGDGRYVYTGSYYQGDVSRFDVTSGNARTTIGVGSWATDVWLTPDGSRLLAHHGQSHGWADSSLAVLNVEGDTFTNLGSVSLGRPGLGDWASGPVAFSSDSRHAYVPTAKSATEGPSLLDIDLTSLSVARSLGFTGDRLTGAVRSGDRLYVASEDQKKIYTVDLTTFTVLGDTINLDYSPDMIALHPDGKHLYALHPTHDRLSVWDVDSRSRVNELAVNAPSDIVFTSDGHTAYVANMYRSPEGARGGVTVLDVNAVPEPCAVVLLSGLGAAGVVLAWRRRRREA